MNDDMKNKIKLKHKLHHCQLRHKRNNKDFAKLEDIRNEIVIIWYLNLRWNIIKISTESKMIRQQVVKLIGQ